MLDWLNILERCFRGIRLIMALHSAVGDNSGFLLSSHTQEKTSILFEDIFRGTATAANRCDAMNNAFGSDRTHLLSKRSWYIQYGVYHIIGIMVMLSFVLLAIYIHGCPSAREAPMTNVSKTITWIISEVILEDMGRSSCATTVREPCA